MSLEGTIRRSGGGPLGTAEEVKLRLSDAFPGVQFTFAARKPPGMAAAGVPLALRLWLAVFGGRRRTAQWLVRTNFGPPKPVPSY